jgi:peptide/nickel transport system substrate-binding protein
VDVAKVLKVMGTGQPAVNPSGLNNKVGVSWLPAVLADKTLKQDSAGARAELAAGGWSVQNGRLSKDGAHLIQIRCAYGLPPLDRWSPPSSAL